MKQTGYTIYIHILILILFMNNSTQSYQNCTLLELVVIMKMIMSAFFMDLIRCHSWSRYRFLLRFHWHLHLRGFRDNDGLPFHLYEELADEYSFIVEINGMGLNSRDEQLADVQGACTDEIILCNSIPVPNLNTKGGFIFSVEFEYIVPERMLSSIVARDCFLHLMLSKEETAVWICFEDKAFVCLEVSHVRSDNQLSSGSVHLCENWFGVKTFVVIWFDSDQVQADLRL